MLDAEAFPDYPFENSIPSLSSCFLYHYTNLFPLEQLSMLLGLLDNFLSLPTKL